jgi:hypothetical protein
LKKVEDTQRKHRLPCRFASTNIGIARNEYQMSKETIMTKALKEDSRCKTVGRTRALERVLEKSGLEKDESMKCSNLYNC